jgi:hypothetical protein
VFAEGMTSGVRIASPMLALSFASLVGCGPSLFALREHEASRALAQAEQVPSRSLARYELTLSRLYLAKAREAAGEAHYRLALDLAARSTGNARRARTLALARATPSGVTPSRASSSGAAPAGRMGAE